MSYKVVIPARYGSTRFPGKPLIDLAGKSMIQHVYERCVDSGADEVIVATDDERIERHVCDFGGDCEVTAIGLPSGTDRIAVVAERRQWVDEVIVVNVQGDEPLIPAAIINQTAALLSRHDGAAASTLSTPIHDKADFLNPNVVKVVNGENGEALYFSRAPIPWNRDHYQGDWALEPNAICKRHIGIYGYRAGFLKRYRGLTQTALEKIECLEQLRILAQGYRMVVEDANELPGHGIDTPEDAQRVALILAKK